jgi:hypothetical protein
LNLIYKVLVFWGFGFMGLCFGTGLGLAIVGLLLGVDPL